MSGKHRPKIPVPPSEGRDAEPFEIEVVAPPGFRPSDWAERLMHFDDAAELGQDLLYLRHSETGRVLIIRAEMLDLSNPRYELRSRVFSGILAFAKENGHTIKIHHELDDRSPVLYGALIAALRSLELPFVERTNS